MKMETTVALEIEKCQQVMMVDYNSIKLINKPIINKYRYKYLHEHNHAEFDLNSFSCFFIMLEKTNNKQQQHQQLDTPEWRRFAYLLTYCLRKN